MSKSLDNLEVGDIICQDNYKYDVLVVDDEFILGSVLDKNGTPVYKWSIDSLEKQGYTIEKPLSTMEVKAKSLLESIGFKVTR